MASSTDPFFHRAAEWRMVEHITRLIDDPRLVLDTTVGRRAVTALLRHVARSDRSMELKRLMTELNPDRALQEKMPEGEIIDVTLKRKHLFVFRSTVGHMQVICHSPARDLIAGKAPQPMSAKDVEAFVRQLPPPMTTAPLTLLLVSTSGFSPEARQLAERDAHRTLILAEPNEAGGWSIHGPAETKALNDLLDPEAEDEKRRRIRAEIEAAKVELLTSGVASDRIAAKTQLPLQVVEAEVKSYARQNPGLAAKRLDGRVVLFREGTTPLSAGATAVNPGALASLGGLGMPLVDRIRSLFARKGETEKKIAFLAERRAALSQQRDRAYEEISALETKDDQLKEEFKAARAPLTKRRITSQLVQLRKDIERRQQMIQVLNQQVNVVSTHLHNLELTQQGQAAQLPDSEEIAADAAAAEEMIAQLQADTELADSVAGVASTAGMSEEEQALYEELEKEIGNVSAPAPEQARTESPRESSSDSAAKPQAEEPKRRAEPEAS